MSYPRELGGHEVIQGCSVTVGGGRGVHVCTCLPLYPTIPLFTHFFFNFIYLFIFGCVGSSFLCEGFLQLRRAGATLHRSVRASHGRGLSRYGAQASDAQAQWLWPTGPAAPRHVGSSHTRARTRFPCIDRQILNQCATREAPTHLNI